MSFTIFLALIIIVCFLLILTIMVQNPKSGGLSSSFGGGGQMGGVQKTTDFSQPVAQAQIVSISDKFKSFGDDMLKICRYFCISKGYVKNFSDDNENSRYSNLTSVGE